VLWIKALHPLGLTMLTSLAPVLQYWLVAFTSIFFLVDPIAAIPTFLIITGDSEVSRRRHMARRAAWTCLLVLACCALAGEGIFRLFGITMPAFQIAGGLILLHIGTDMLQARRSYTKETPGDTEEGVGREDVGVIPLGIPMLAGPGSISTVMVLMGQSANWWHKISVITAIVLTAFLSYWILAAADRVRHALGETGIRITMRLMGLMLMAIAVQFILRGLSTAGIARMPSGPTP